MLKPVQRAPETVLEDVVSTALFALVAALPEAANLLPKTLADDERIEQRDAIARFRD